MIKPGKTLGYMKYASAKDCPRSAKNLLKFEIEYIVLGHGAPGGKKLLTKTIKNAENHIKALK